MLVGGGAEGEVEGAAVQVEEGGGGGVVGGGAGGWGGLHGGRLGGVSVGSGGGDNWGVWGRGGAFERYVRDSWLGGYRSGASGVEDRVTAGSGDDGAGSAPAVYVHRKGVVM